MPPMPKRLPPFAAPFLSMAVPLPLGARLERYVPGGRS
jgi:hypothetical protein